MADEKIKIDIQATYDDDDAKAALADAKAIEKADPTLDVTADTGAASSELAGITDQAEKLSSRDWITKVLADTEAAKADIDAITDKLHSVDDAATATGNKLGTEMESGTNKASQATHSMAGNVLGDSAAMATGFGPLGEALGQITEGALGGEIALKQMLSAGLGLAAITVVVGAIQKGLEANKKIDAFNTKKIDEFAKALQTAKGELDVFNTALRGKDNKIEFVDAATGATEDLTSALATAGITWDEFVKHIAGGKDAFREWLIVQGPAIGAGKDLNAIIQAGTQYIDDRAKAQKAYDDQLIVSGQVAHETDRETRRLNAAYVDGSSALADLNPKTDTFAHHVNTAAENTAKLNEKYRLLVGKLDEQEGWENVNKAVKDYNDNTKHSDADTRTLIRSIADYVTTTDTIPESKKTKILVDLNAGDVAAAEADLTELARERDIRLLITAVGSQDTIKLLRSISRGGAGILDESRSAPGGTVAGATIQVSLPRGARHADIARALGVSSRRNGRRYEQVTYARR